MIGAISNILTLFLSTDDSEVVAGGQMIHMYMYKDKEQHNTGDDKSHIIQIPVCRETLHQSSDC